MEAGFIVIAIIGAMIIGALIGASFEKSRAYRRVSKGFIYVDCKDANTQPGLFLQCTVPIEDIASSKQVLFDVTVLD